jgi:hypothetical protein
MVPHRGITDLSRLPLLPFERDLIAALGCTEAEYRAFTIEVMRRARVRPAEYDHIPEIVAGPLVVPATAATIAAGTAGTLTTLGVVLVNVAVGIALSAISFLLTPKPKGGEQIEQRRLGDRTGASRFAQTFGFDSQAELANYNQPIPIIFALYTGSTGGILAPPSLVWSRAASYGRQQGLKQLLIVGEAGLGAGIPAPELNGIFIGTSPIDAALSHTFAFYWNRDGGRIVGSNLLYGTRGGVATGDP